MWDFFDFRAVGASAPGAPNAPGKYWEVDGRGHGHWHDADTNRYTRAPREEDLNEMHKLSRFKVDPNLVINTVNLGVSVYNAYQLRVVRKQLTTLTDDVAVGREEVRAFREEAHRHHQQATTLLAQHSALLAQLNDGQQNIAARLERLQVALEEGFARTGQSIDAATAARRTDELESRSQHVLSYTRDLIDALGTDLQKIAAERVVTSSTDLLGWLDTRVKNYPAGDPARLPLLVAKAAALRWRLDARAFEGFSLDSLARERYAFADEVAREAHAVVDGQTVHAIAVERRELVAAYVFLHRAFTTAHIAAIDEHGVEQLLFPVGTFAWDDHLDNVRATFSTSSTVERSAPLSSLASESWLRAWRTDGTVGDLLDVLGVPRAVDGADVDRMQALQPFVTHAGRASVADVLQREFGWEQAPVVVAGAGR